MIFFFFNMKLANKMQYEIEKKNGMVIGMSTYTTDIYGI